MSENVRAHYEPFGERGWLAWLSGLGDDVASGLFANAAADIARSQTGVTDAVAGIDSVSLRFDPAVISAAEARDILADAVQRAPAQTDRPGKTIDIPVLYGGEAGPDLENLCTEKSLSPEEYAARHAGRAYRVITLGFAPGFAYLGPLDGSLGAPRLPTPRAHVPAGSVGVAGAFTGVYSLPSPGGWRIIGRTPIKLFDPASPAPFQFAPGDKARFRPIDQTEFNALASPPL
ncbi:MAG: 5-oxoprolinase subunit PxpB [Hyphococcus sp.]